MEKGNLSRNPGHRISPRPLSQRQSEICKQDPFVVNDPPEQLRNLEELKLSRSFHVCPSIDVTIMATIRGPRRSYQSHSRESCCTANLMMG